eukprot:9146697-Pyramimonas_sp.AAC.1
MFACPVRQIYAYEPRKLWRLTLSDHALISLEPPGARRARREDTMRAADLRSLPTAAHADLRQRCAYLELTFGVPPVNLTGLLQPIDWVRPACPGGFPDWQLDNDDGDTSVSNLPSAQQDA